MKPESVKRSSAFGFYYGPSVLVSTAHIKFVPKNCLFNLGFSINILYKIFIYSMHAMRHVQHVVLNLVPVAT